MITQCKFDAQKDIQETVPGLAMSIEMALTTGVIKDSSDTTPYSKMTSTEEIGHYLHDTIDIALEARRLGTVLANAQSMTENVGNNGNPGGAS